MLPNRVVDWGAVSSWTESCTSVWGALLRTLLCFVGCVVALSDDMISVDIMPTPLCAELLSLSLLTDDLFFIGENVSCPKESCSESQSNQSKSPLSRPVRDSV